MPLPSHISGAISAAKLWPTSDTNFCKDGTWDAACTSGIAVSWPVRMTNSVAEPASGAGKPCATACSCCRAAAGAIGPDASLTKRTPPSCRRSSASTTVITSDKALGNNCAPLSTILSNTGWASSTDAAMTFSTSLVAVWCASASLVSLNRRAFRIAITAWSAKVASNSICRSDRRPGSGDDIEITPMATPSCINGAEAIERNDSSRVCDLKKMSLPGARLSATCTARPSTTARPEMLCRSIGTTSGP